MKKKIAAIKFLRTLVKVEEDISALSSDFLVGTSPHPHNIYTVRIEFKNKCKKCFLSNQRSPPSAADNLIP